MTLFSFKLTSWKSIITGYNMIRTLALLKSVISNAYHIESPFICLLWYWVPNLKTLCECKLIITTTSTWFPSPGKGVTTNNKHIWSIKRFYGSMVQSCKKGSMTKDALACIQNRCGATTIPMWVYLDVISLFGTKYARQMKSTKSVNKQGDNSMGTKVLP